MTFKKQSMQLFTTKPPEEDRVSLELKFLALNQANLEQIKKPISIPNSNNGMTQIIQLLR